VTVNRVNQSEKYITVQTLVKTSETVTHPETAADQSDSDNDLISQTDRCVSDVHTIEEDNTKLVVEKSQSAVEVDCAHS